MNDLKKLREETDSTSQKMVRLAYELAKFGGLDNAKSEKLANIILTNFKSFIEQEKLKLLDTIGEPQLNDVPTIPTPREYEAMMFVVDWYKDRIKQLQQSLISKEVSGDNR